MPVLPASSYRPPPGFSNGHIQTLFPALFRRTRRVTRRRERISTPDGDFLDLDCADAPDPRRVAILSHGLEGASDNPSVQGMAAALRQRGWNVVAWNFRGCSGEPNRLLRSYHSGATEDLRAVIDHVSRREGHQETALIGFSLGGNLTLKYLGEPDPDPRIIGAVAFSVPCDLAASSQRLEHPSNRLYMGHFLRGLRAKVRAKRKQFPGEIDDAGLDRIRTFREFDGAYTAPLNGFRSPEDYWERASCLGFLGQIRIPVLLVNAANDPFLAPSCFPRAAAQDNPNLVLEIPASGGHLGFVTFNRRNEYWTETRAAEFLDGCRGSSAPS